MKVDKQSHFTAIQAQIRQQLRLVNRIQPFNCLNLNDHKILDHKVKPVSAIELDGFVDYRQRSFLLNPKSAFPQFEYETT